MVNDAEALCGNEFSYCTRNAPSKIPSISLMEVMIARRRFRDLLYSSIGNLWAESSTLTSIQSELLAHSKKGLKAQHRVHL